MNFFVNDNLIHRETSEGFKENSLERDSLTKS